jgi:hypothetical protein
LQLEDSEMPNAMPFFTALRPLAVVGWVLATAAPAAWAQDNATPSALPAQRAVIDRDTGRLRLPENDEIATPAAGATARSATAAKLQSHPVGQRMQGQPIATQQGAVGQRLDPSRMSFSVGRKSADGRVQPQCVSGEDAAMHAGHAGPVEGAEGDRNDR